MAELDWGSVHGERVFTLIYQKLYQHKLLSAGKLGRIKDEALMQLLEMAATETAVAPLDPTLKDALFSWLQSEREMKRGACGLRRILKTCGNGISTVTPIA